MGSVLYICSILHLYNVAPYRRINDLRKLLSRLCLRKCPHDLCEYRLRGHTVSLGELVFLLDSESNLIDRHIAALVRNLRRDDDPHALLNKQLDLVGKLVIFVVGKTAYAKALNYDRVRALGNVIEDIRAHTRRQLDEHYVRIDLVIELNGLGITLLDIVAHLARADESYLGVVNA